MSDRGELANESATSLAQRIARRDLSPVEVMDEVLRCIEARDPRLNAFVYRGFDEAMTAARHAEQEVLSGRPLPPLHGVPTAMKDLFDFKRGWPSTFGGIPALADRTASVDCVFVERVERAGAIVVGKTNSSLMGFRGTCDNPLFGATANPFDLDPNSGGSSGGSAAAVADGLLSFAEGTDGGGSIRIPAAWCGLYGHKPSFGRVPVVARPNGFGSASPFVTEGALTRTVADAALVLDVLSGVDHRDPYSTADSPSLLPALERGVDQMLIGYTPDFGVYPVQPEVARQVADAAGSLASMGARVHEIQATLSFDQRALSDLWCRLIMVPSFGVMDQLQAEGIDLIGDHHDELPDAYLEWIEVVRSQTTRGRIADEIMRTAVYDALEEQLAHFDLIVSPTVSCLPVLNSSEPGSTVGPSSVEGVAVDPLIGWCLTYLTNFTGHPSASVPVGLADGLPVGMQLIGRRGRDDDVIRAAAALERSRPWHHWYERQVG